MMVVQVLSRVCAPISTSSADCRPTSWQRTCRVWWSFCCRGCPSGSTWNLHRREPHSASSPFWPSRRRAAAYWPASRLALSPGRSTSGCPPVSCSCSAPLSSTLSSTRWLADRSQRRPATARICWQPRAVLHWLSGTQLKGWERDIFHVVNQSMNRSSSFNVKVWHTEN